MRSPPRRRSARGRQRQCRLYHLGQPRGDVVKAAGVDGDLSPARCICTRAPSSFASKTAVPPSVSSASATPAAVWASIGPTGRPTRRVNASSAAVPLVNAAAATAGSRRPASPRAVPRRRGSAPPWRPHRPSHRPARPGAARRPAAAAGMSARFRLRREQSATNSARRACEPLPDTAPIAERAASTPVTVRPGCTAAGGNDRKAAQPTPIWRCGSSPESHETTIATSLGSDSAG